MSHNNIEAIIREIPLLSGISSADINIQKLSGLSNNNYLITTPEQSYVLRVPQKSTAVFINRNNEAYNADIAQTLGIAPRNLWRGSTKLAGISLTKFIDNTSQLKKYDSQNIKKLTDTLLTLHRSKQPFKGLLDNQKIVKFLKQYFRLCSSKQQQTLKANYNKALLLLGAQHSNRPAVPSHVDLVPENILLQNEKLYLIDWEYSAMASPFWDIATVCNAANFDETSSETFLKTMLKDYQKNDLKTLEQFRFITKTISDCWQAAFTINNS